MTLASHPKNDLYIKYSQFYLDPNVSDTAQEALDHFSRKFETEEELNDYIQWLIKVLEDNSIPELEKMQTYIFEGIREDALDAQKNFISSMIKLYWKAN